MLGVAFNTVAVFNNDCKMPVLASYNYNGEKHFTFNNKDDINFFYLSDIFKLFQFHFSIGDIFLTIGGVGFIFIFVYQAKQYRILKKGGIWR